MTPRPSSDLPTFPASMVPESALDGTTGELFPCDHVVDIRMYIACLFFNVYNQMHKNTYFHEKDQFRNSTSTGNGQR